MNMNEIMENYGKWMIYFNAVEVTLKEFINKHYFKSLNMQFQQEILEDKHMSFFLVKNYFYKITKKHYPTFYKSFPNKSLDELNELRNILAHAYMAGSFSSSGSLKPHLSYGDRKISINALFSRLQALQTKLDPSIDKVRRHSF